MSMKQTNPDFSHATPAYLNTPTTEPQNEEANQAFAAVLSDKKNSVFIAVSAGLRQYHLESTYDTAFVLNEAYFRACKAIDRKSVV